MTSRPARVAAGALAARCGGDLTRRHQQAQMVREHRSDRNRRNRDVADGGEGCREHYGGDRDERRVRTFRCENH